MDVAELIAELKKHPLNSEVCLTDKAYPDKVRAIVIGVREVDDGCESDGFGWGAVALSFRRT